MKEFYLPPQLHIFCFAPREHLASLEIGVSLSSGNDVLNSSAPETEMKPGDIFIPIIPSS